MNHKFTAVATLAICAAVVGCRRPRQTVVVQNPEPQPKPATVVVEKGHTHAPTCGHYFHNGHWYSDPEHVYIIE